MSYFTFLRATTKDVFAVHIEQGRNVPLPTANDQTLAQDSPGFLGYETGTAGKGISDPGIKWWMVFYNVPPAQWPSGITP